MEFVIPGLEPGTLFKVRQSASFETPLRGSSG